MKKFGIVLTAVITAVLVLGAAYAADTTEEILEFTVQFRGDGPAVYKSASDDTTIAKAEFNYCAAYEKAGIELDEESEKSEENICPINVNPVSMDKFLKDDPDRNAIIAAGALNDEVKKGVVVGIEFITPDDVKGGKVTFTCDGKTVSEDLTKETGRVHNGNFIKYFYVTDENGQCLPAEKHKCEIAYTSGDTKMSTPGTFITNANNVPADDDSGCNAGFGALALLALLPIAFRRKK